MAECDKCGKPAAFQHVETGEFYCIWAATNAGVPDHFLIDLEEENKK